MDALAALQYLPMLLVVGGAVVAALATALWLSRRSASPSSPDSPSSPASPSSPVLPNVMLLFAAAALGFGVVLLLPAMMILRYFPHWQVVSVLIAGAVILLIPMGYLWRARSF